MGSKALYGWRDDADPVETFELTCHRCRRTVTHTRLVVTRRRTLCWVAIGNIGEPRTIVRCRSCGHETHIRDLVRLATPTQIAKYTFALRAAITDVLSSGGTGRTGAGSGGAEARAAAIDAMTQHYSIFTAADLDADRAAGLDAELDEALTELCAEASPPVTAMFVRQLVPIVAAAAGDAAVTERLRPIAACLNVTDDRLRVMVERSLGA